MQAMTVNGTNVEYVDNGAAAPALLFLHGAVTDLRMWDVHRALAGERYRTIAYTQRYHGTGEWSATWPPYGVPTHSGDLIAFVEKLGVGPVHLVAWSYSGQTAFDAALRRPDLFRSVFVYEPGVPSFVTDPAALAAWGADAGAAFGPIFGAVTEGDNVKALELLLDASGQSAGYFERQSAASRAIQLANARTMSELMLRQQPAPQITCEQLAGLKVPTRVGYGADSRPLYSVVGGAAQGCIGGTGHLRVEGRNHMWPDADPAGFMRAVEDFVETQ